MGGVGFGWVRLVDRKWRIFLRLSGENGFVRQKRPMVFVSGLGSSQIRAAPLEGWHLEESDRSPAVEVNVGVARQFFMTAKTCRQAF
jgi:hypothetical protein